MRKRNNDVHIMLSNSEYSSLQNIQRKSGLRLRELIMNAVSDKPFISAEYIDELRKLNEVLSRIYIELHKIGVNINQIARVANSTGELPAENQLADLSAKLELYRKGCEKVWQFTKRSIQKATGLTER